MFGRQKKTPTIFELLRTKAPDAIHGIGWQWFVSQDVAGYEHDKSETFLELGTGEERGERSCLRFVAGRKDRRGYMGHELTEAVD